MATVTRENISELNDKLTLSLSKQDYLPAFEKSLKDYSKKANIPGFRKGMVPAGLIRKMYGSSLFTDEVLRSVDRELVKYLETEKLEIFAQPLPDEVNLRQLDMNSPADYHFSFEIGLKPSFDLPPLDQLKVKRYKVQVTDEMIDTEIARLQNRYGNMKEEHAVASEENVLNITFIEVDENGSEQEGGATKENSLLVKYFAEPVRKDLFGKSINDFVIAKVSQAFEEKEREWVIGDLGIKDHPDAENKTFKMLITKIGLLEKRDLNEDFFNQLYPGGEVKTEADFRNRIRDEIQAYWDGQAKSQLQHQAYHELLDHTEIKFPQSFLKKWMRTQDAEREKTENEIEQEFPTFISQLRWTLISDKIVAANAIQVTPDEIRNFAKQQLFGYMGMANSAEQQPWVDDYIERMMKDRKYIEDSYNRIQSQKILDWVETQLKPEETEIPAEEFTKMVESHQHHH
jgi:trigger factor